MNILLVGAGGYGALYVRQLLDHRNEHDVVWEGIVDPYFDACAEKEKILQAAEESFAEKGLYGARVDEIAALSTVNKRMIYEYFGNKEKETFTWEN